jgi:hypothetical protein
MNKLQFSIFILFFFVFSLSSFAQQKLLVGGSGWKQVAIIDKNTANIEWSYDLPEGSECNCVQQTSDGNILFSYKKGARLITPAKEIIWDFVPNKSEEVQTARQLPNGNYFLAICGQPARFITLDKQGKLISEQNYDLGIENNHRQFRRVTATENETFIVPVFGRGEVLEIDKNSKVLKRVQVGGNLFAVKILPNKNWLVSCGDAHKLVLVNPKKEKIIKTISDADIKECSLYYVAESFLLENGNYLIANWNGHVNDKSQAKILEIDKNNKVVWTLPHNKNITNISAIYFWEDPK